MGVGIYIALVVVAVLIVLYLLYQYIGRDLLIRNKVDKMMRGDLARNGPEIVRLLDEIRTPISRDYVARAKVARQMLRGQDRITVPAKNYRAALRAATREGCRDTATVVSAIAAENWEEDPTYIRDVIAALTELDRETAVISAGNAQKVAENARAAAETPVEAAAAAINTAREYTGDGQNSHDAAVTQGLRETLDRIGVIDSNHAVDFQREVARGSPVAVAAYQKMMQGGGISTYGTNERTLLSTVLSRADHPLNAANRDNIRAAVLGALEDCSSDGTPATLVCTNGRCARVIGALAGLDFDPEVARIGTVSMWKNQIFGQIKDKIADITRRECESDDPLVRTGARIYAGLDDGDPTDAVMEPFSRKIRGEIDGVISEFTGKISSAELEKTRSESYTYAGI